MTAGRGESVTLVVTLLYSDESVCALSAAGMAPQHAHRSKAAVLCKTKDQTVDDSIGLRGGSGAPDRARQCVVTVRLAVRRDPATYRLQLG